MRPSSWFVRGCTFHLPHSPRDGRRTRHDRALAAARTSTHAFLLAIRRGGARVWSRTTRPCRRMRRRPSHGREIDPPPPRSSLARGVPCPCDWTSWRRRTVATMAMRITTTTRATAGPRGAKGRWRRKHEVHHVARKRSGRTGTERDARCAAFFGVGAPEAIVVGAVALLVFGPQGLAQAAKALGATLKSLAPTIRELQDVSTDFRSTLEKEIGLEDIGSLTSTSSFLASNAAKSSMDGSRSFMDEKFADDPLQVEDEAVEEVPTPRMEVEPSDGEGTESSQAREGWEEEEMTLDEMRKKSQEMAWNASNLEPSESEERSQDDEEFTVEEIQAEIKRRKKLSALSLEELEAKLEHRLGTKGDPNATDRSEM